MAHMSIAASIRQPANLIISAIFVLIGIGAALIPDQIIQIVLLLIAGASALCIPYLGVIILLLIRGLWDATQFAAIPGVSWWNPIFVESGPVLLPVIALATAILIVRLLPLPPAPTRLRSSDILNGLVVLTIVLGLVIALARGNDLVRAIKDAAFLGGLLLAPGIARLPKERAQVLFVTTLLIAACFDLLTLFEALRRMVYFDQDLQTFLLHTYRIFKTDHFAPFITLIGFFLVTPWYRRDPKTRLLLVIGLYYASRFAFNFTRLNWIILAATMIAYIGLNAALLRPRVLARVAAVLIFLAGVLYLTNYAATGSWDIRQQPLIRRFSSINTQTDVSIRFRLTESRLLWQGFRSAPIFGTGLGGTISPLDPDEPLRNDISSFFNGYFGLLYKVGIVGTACILLYCGVLLRQIRKAQRSASDPFSRGMLNGAFLYCLGLVLIAPVSDILFGNFYTIVFSLIVGCALASARVRPTDESGTA